MITFEPLCNGTVSETVIRCPLGLLRLKTCSSGVHVLNFDSSGNFETSIDCDQNVQNSDKLSTNPKTIVVTWLHAYFQNPSALESTQLPKFCFLSESDTRDRFADTVLKELIKIKFGDTVSYSELAKRAGNEKASRAVGQVMRSNPVCLIIPCHRVVLKSGGHGHYGGGKIDEIKVNLLEYEAGEKVIWEC